jgi:hypothetical protein
MSEARPLMSPLRANPAPRHAQRIKRRTVASTGSLVAAVVRVLSGFLTVGRHTPRPSRPFLSAFAFVALASAELLTTVRTVLYCGECWRFLRYANGGEDVISWIPACATGACHGWRGQ